MAGPSLQHQESHVYMRDFRGCRWALIQWFDFQRRLKILPGSKSKGMDFPLLSQDGDSTDMDSDSSMTLKRHSRKKSSRKSKALLKSFIPKKFYRKQDQKQKILPLSPQLLRTISIHHLEPKNSKKSGTSSSSSSSSSSSTRSSLHGNIGIMAVDSSSRNENDSLLPRHLNVIQEKSVNRSSSVPSKMYADLNSTHTGILDATGDAESTQNRPQISKNLKQMITMDGVLHKIPYGQKIPEHPRSSKNLNLFRSVSVTYDRSRSNHMMKRSVSLTDSVGRYSQLLESLSRESTQKGTQSSMYSGTEPIKDGLFEKNESEVFILQVPDAETNPSEDSFTQSMDATHSLSSAVESVSLPPEQHDAEGFHSESRILESGDECVDLVSVEENEEFSDVRNEASANVSEYEILQENSVSVLDSDFDDPVPEKRKISEGNSEAFGENVPVLADFDILPSQLVQGNEADLENLKDLFENYGFGDGDFLEIINILLQEVRQENDKLPVGYDFTKFDYDFGGFYYDENMSLDQNILYALTHEALRENLKKYLSSGTLVSSYAIVPRSDSLQNGLIKNLSENLNCYVNSEIGISARNFIDGILTSDSLQNDGWLNYLTEREHLGVELGDQIFDSLIDELVRELIDDELGAAGKLLPCDHEVTGSSPGNSLLQKCRERLHTKDLKWSDPFPNPAQVGAMYTSCPVF